MIRQACLCLLLSAQTAFAGVAEDAANAAANLQSAVTALTAAEGSSDRIKALTDTIRAYEMGLAALREDRKSVV